eukprot:1457748-Alexandrium_andersonii.AAC.1
MFHRASVRRQVNLGGRPRQAKCRAASPHPSRRPGGLAMPSRAACPSRRRSSPVPPEPSPVLSAQ